MATQVQRHQEPLSGGAEEDNTLGVVLMQRGHRKEAEEIFARLMEDERPHGRLVNAYFYGLCRWMAGAHDEAGACWRSVADVDVHDTFGRVIQEAIAAVDAGEDPTWLYLWPPK